MICIINRISKRMFEGQNYVSFADVDLSVSGQVLPKDYELILCRDALQHLSYELIASTIENFCGSNAKYLLVGSYISAKRNKNRNIAVGLAFSINLLATPFNFPRPLEIYNERTRDGKYLLLYELSRFCPSEGVNSFIKSFKK